MLDVEKLLIDLGIDFKHAGPNNFKALCINPDHNEKLPSMHIHKESGLVHCFGCSLTGNVFTLLKYKGIVGIDALTYLQKYAKGGQSEEEIRKALEDFVNNRSNAEQVIKYENVELPMHRMIDDNFYLSKRGITPKEIKEWSMSVVTQGMYLGWILIPIYQDGIIRNYFLRNTLGTGKIYGTYPRKDLLAGIDFADNYDKPICVTEGIFDTIFVRKTGFQSVACLSNRLLPGQLNILKKYSKVIIVPDNDAMGIKLVESAGSLIHSTDLVVCELPKDKKDAAECTPMEIFSAFQKEIKWNEFMINKKFNIKNS